MGWKKKKEEIKVIEPDEAPSMPQEAKQQVPLLGKTQAQIVETIMLEGGLLRSVVISGVPLGHVGERIDLE